MDDTEVVPPSEGNGADIMTEALRELQCVLAGGGDAEGEMKGVVRNPACDFFGPLDSKAVGTGQEIIEHERLDLGVAFEAVGIEVDERARAAVERENGEGGACHRGLDTEAAGEALDEGGFADAEIAVQGEGDVGREGGGKFGGEGLGLDGRGGLDAVAELIEDVHSHDGR
jgi:hypothetical protein